MKILRDGKPVEVDRAEYMRAKTKQLAEFGYSHLTEQEVSSQLDAVLDGKTFGKGLTVIGMFIKEDLPEAKP